MLEPLEQRGFSFGAAAILPCVSRRNLIVLLAALQHPALCCTPGPAGIQQWHLSLYAVVSRFSDDGFVGLTADSSQLLALGQHFRAPV
jgi:hypothetical protein